MVLLFAFTLLPALGGFSLDARQAAPKQYMVVIFSTGPKWDHAKPFGEQQGASTHSKNLQRLRAEKLLTVGARYSDKGMVILEATTEADARAQFASDEMVRDSVFTMEVHKWSPFYKGCVE
ncbi:MAG: hypothetical protein L0Y80_10145 [Ignavibacteriae bacterium]|nr:hypothetical protein [Ignavibacteriota bacterium]